VPVFDTIDHLGIAVEGLDAAVASYRATFDMALVHREVIAEHGVEVALLEIGDEHVELLAPLSADTPVGRFLARRGPGIHHVAYGVSDIDATLAELKARDVELIDTVPRTGVRSSRVAFVHPRSTGGVLTEIVQEASNGE
jgi:methylmalonyl-CoA/ethylmalonyl-CoA epimerase